MEEDDGRTSILFRVTGSKIRGASQDFVSIEVSLHGIGSKEAWQKIDGRLHKQGLRIHTHEDIQAGAMRLLTEENKRLEQANIDLLTKCYRLERQIQELELELGPYQ